MANDTVKLPVKLKDGSVLTDELLDELIREVEAGYDPATLHPAPSHPGRPSLSPVGVSPRIQFRAPADIYELARSRAGKEGRTVSAVMRDLLADYARGEGTQPRVGC